MSLDRFDVKSFNDGEYWIEKSDEGMFVKWADIQILFNWLEKSYRDSDNTLKFAIRLRDELDSFRTLFDENDPSSGKLIQEFDDFVKSMANSMIGHH